MAYCKRCERSFPHLRALEQHIQNSNSHWLCDDCDIDFETFSARREHFIQSPNHHYCRECDRHFRFDESRRQHMDAKHWYCRLHDKVFKSEAGLESHYKQSSDHNLCSECGADFDDANDLWEHAEEDHDACRQCQEIFDSRAELRSHDRDVHTYCTDCQRGFLNGNNLRQHLDSKIHQPANVRCPGRGCGRLFISHGALTLHFESGTCPSGMTRGELNRLVVRADRNNYITNPDRLLTGPLGQPLAKSTWATELSWNGEEYECFLCHSTFATLGRLNLHLQSPRHEEKIYRCPKSDCRTQFVTLSGLCQHVEGGSCGVRIFRRVRDVMESLKKGFNALTV
ncbi:hypothetical protein F5148DRAFT_1151681 [Russula earlei]|uniref:Uncharacterized protein n=1 Tax=Russula earlei TaxID=71964 RepID=A0ACC0U053_9AGAM|nr:hypothetical protein F5148DRAFT_1151681 [Russula earlei]